MGKIDLAYGALMAVLSAVFFAVTFTFPSRSGGIDPRTFPRFVIICTFILSAVLTIRGILGVANDRKAVRGNAGSGDQAPRKRQADELKPPGEAVSSGGRNTSFRLAVLAVSGFAYSFIIGFTGYLVATPLLLAASMAVFGEKRRLRILLVSVLTTIVLYYLFRGVFRVPLPRSIVR